MPKMDGFKVCEQIRSEPEISKTKIIAISGYDTQENKNKILKIGADSFCPKPIDSHQIMKEVNRLMK
jgi:CheY-like chemotaxis protein